MLVHQHGRASDSACSQAVVFTSATPAAALSRVEDVGGESVVGLQRELANGHSRTGGDVDVFPILNPANRQPKQCRCCVGPAVRAWAWFCNTRTSAASTFASWLGPYSAYKL